MSWFDPRAITGLLAVALCFAFALVLFRAGDRGGVARKLALLLVVEGVTLASSISVASLFLDPASPNALSLRKLIHTVGDCSLLAMYPSFLAVALQTPLTRPFATRGAQRALVVGAAALGAASMWWAATRGPEGFILLYVAMAAVYWFALFASVSAWRRSASDVGRARGRAFAIAFGVRDLLWGVVYSSLSALTLFGTSRGFQGPDWDVIVQLYSCGTLIAVPLIAYEILKVHLLDIELRLKWTIRQSTLAGVFVALSFFLSEAAGTFLSARLGNFSGLVLASLLVFFLSPLQRLAERVSNAAMPNTHDTPEYRAFKKLQIYQAALAEARFSGDVSPRERALLTRLRDTLGISAADAEALERDQQSVDVIAASDSRTMAAERSVAP